MSSFNRTHQPAYLHLREKLKSEIKTGALKPGDRIASNKELSEKFKVSQVTVRQAILALAREGYVNVVPRVGSYVTHRGQRRLSHQQSNIVALLIPTIQNPFFGEIAQEIEALLLTHGYSLVLCNTEGDTERSHSYLNILKEKVDGFIIAPDSSSEDRTPYRELQRLNIPFVLFDKTIKGIQADTVSVNNYEGARLAVDHLLELGHRSITCIAGLSSEENISERVRGYRETLQEHELKDAVISFEELPGRKLGYKVAEEFFARKNRATAIFATNDILCVGIIEAARAHGLKIPDDIAIVGFDDISIDQLLEIPLTTISQSEALIAKYVVELLLSKISGQREPQIQQILLEPKLIVRQSTVLKEDAAESYPIGRKPTDAVETKEHIVNELE